VADPLLIAENVTKNFGDMAALDAASLVVELAECVALVGESGAGKSTLLRCFNRLVEPDAGTVSVRGRQVRTQDPILLRRGIGYVPQEGGLLPHWSVLRNVGVVPWLAGEPESAGRGEDALRLVGLEPERFGERRPRELSGGQRQRAALARALAARPDIVLLDEPFGALDAITRADLQATFHRLQRELGLTAVLVTHDLREAFELGDRVVVMRAGRVEQAAAPTELLTSPATPYVKELLTRARMRDP
jgi:osmoprotectant transport system ATP-binding protein